MSYNMYLALWHMVDMLKNQDPEHKSVREPLIGSSCRVLLFARNKNKSKVEIKKNRGAYIKLSSCIDQRTNKVLTKLDNSITQTSLCYASLRHNFHFLQNGRNILE